MEFLLSSLYSVGAIALEEFWAFSGLKDFVEVASSGDLERILSQEGLYALAAPLIPFLLLSEILAMIARGNFHWRNIRVPMLAYVVNRVIARAFTLSFAFALMGFLQPFALFQVEFSWYGFIYGYLVFEFSHFIYHWLGHRVRLFWCLHATHHVPEHMNLSVSYAHFFLEAPFADLIRVGLCTLLGMPMELVLLVAGIDSIWGHVIHVSEEVLPDGRLGWLGRFVLTPSHHRIHHSRNALYKDRNFCNLLPVWDRLFGTYQEEVAGERPEYGITRDIDANNLYDAYCSEVVCLARDVLRTPGVANKVRLLFMPPGWTPESVRVQAERAAGR
ncbi:MAG: sterol desaturase family protein [Halioglobus sp.]|nr:sterol desaturase family protein [Halioglobus sp.]